MFHITLWIDFRLDGGYPQGPGRVSPIDGSVPDVDIIDALTALNRQGMNLLAALADGRLNRARLVSFGYSGSTAGEWVALSETYFGRTRHRRQQGRAVEAARAGGLSVEAIAAVEKHVRKLLDGDEWALRVELCALTGTVDEIDKAAAARVRELNRAVPDAEAKSFGRRSLKGGKNTDACGLRHISVGLPERTMADILTRLRETAAKLRRSDKKLTYEQAMADAFVAHLLGDASGTPSVITPLVVIGLPDWAKLLRHEADDTLFGLTDGTTMTGAELIRARMAEHHLVGIWDPFTGPVNLYRAERLANLKQRLLASADTLLCPVRDCTTSADECQMHHLDAWVAGGETNLDRMTVACRVHNARNDDNPGAPPRHGRLDRDESGRIVFRPPDGSGPVTNSHPVRRLSAREVVRKQY